MVLASRSEIIRARSRERSISFTWLVPSSAWATRKPMLPPPAMKIRRTGSSSLRISRMTVRMSWRAAMKNTSSFSSRRVLPSGMISCPSR